MSYGNPHFASSDYRQNIKIVGEKCRVCLTCVRKCPQAVISFDDVTRTITLENLTRCLSCYQCIEACPVNAIVVRV